MPTVRSVYGQIGRVERFDVHFLYEGPGPRSGRDVRDDRKIVLGYRFKKAASDCTVAAWIERRFRTNFPGFEVEVLLGDGSVADHRMLLSTVRGTYTN